MRIWAKILRRRTLLTFSSGDSAILRRRTFSEDCSPEKFRRVQAQVDTRISAPGEGDALTARTSLAAGRGRSGLRPKRGAAAAAPSGSGAERQRGRDAAGQRCSWLGPSGTQRQRVGDAAGRGRSGSRPKRGTAEAARRYSGVGMRRGGDAAGRSLTSAQLCPSLCGFAQKEGQRE